MRRLSYFRMSRASTAVNWLKRATLVHTGLSSKSWKYVVSRVVERVKNHLTHIPELFQKGFVRILPRIQDDISGSFRDLSIYVKPIIHVTKNKHTLASLNIIDVGPKPVHRPRLIRRFLSSPVSSSTTLVTTDALLPLKLS